MRPLRFPFLPGLLLTLFCLGVVASTRAQLTPRTLVQAGVTRTWYEHVPASYDGTKPVPLVIVLHGVFSTGDQFAPQSEWTPVSDQAGFIVVYPNGGLYYNPTSLGWNSYVYDGSAPDDVGFLHQLIQTLETTYAIDPNRVYMTGFSNGAGMANTFCGNGYATDLAAMAPASCSWLTTFGTPEPIQHPGGTIPTWISRGSLETSAEGSETLAVQDANQTAYWAGIDGCNPTPQNIVDGIFTTAIYTGGQGEVCFSTVAGYGHQYGPGFAAKIWHDFFSQIVRGVPSAPLPTPIPVITSALFANGVPGVPFTYQITASNSPTGYASPTAPAGMTVNTSTGLLSLTPAAPLTYSFAIQASNADGTGTAILALSVVNAPAHPAFFTGEVLLGSAYYLQFANGNPFGYYAYLADANYLYHFDLGYEYVSDANDGLSGVYFYDFTSSDFFYTSPNFPFPFLFDFNLNSVVYYFPDPSNPGRYNTDGIRYFYVFSTGEIVSK